MAGERTLNWAPEGETPKYRTQDTDPNGGDFIVVETPSDGTVLLQWNDTAGQWEYGGPVDLGGNDLSSVGALDATSVTTGDLQSDNITVSSNTESDITEHAGDQVSVSANSWQTIFDLASSERVITGHINGLQANELRVTEGDGTTYGVYTGANNTGQDQDGTTYSTLPVPPLSDAQKLEFFNESATEEAFGWKVLTI